MECEYISLLQDDRRTRRARADKEREGKREKKKVTNPFPPLSLLCALAGHTCHPAASQSMSAAQQQQQISLEFPIEKDSESRGRAKRPRRNHSFLLALGAFFLLLLSTYPVVMLSVTLIFW